MNHKQHNEIMKKKYLEPASVVVNLTIDSHLLTGSPIKIDSGTGEETGGSEALSQREGWSSDNWAEGDE